MPSTYTLNNGIELIGTGEQSGTWGDTTNTNLGLLDAALDGQVTMSRWLPRDPLDLLTPFQSQTVRLPMAAIAWLCFLTAAI
jgi:hypothetical protein